MQGGEWERLSNWTFFASFIWDCVTAVSNQRGCQRGDQSSQREINSSKSCRSKILSKPRSIQEDQFQIKDPGNQSGCQNRVEINLKRDLGQIGEKRRSSQVKAEINFQSKMMSKPGWDWFKDQVKSKRRSATDQRSCKCQSWDEIGSNWSSGQIKEDMKSS